MKARIRRAIGTAVLLAAMLPGAGEARADDGYDLWLRYRPLAAAQRSALAPFSAEICAARSSPMLSAAIDEAVRGMRGMTGIGPRTGRGGNDCGIVLARLEDASRLGLAALPSEIPANEGFRIGTSRAGGRRAIVILARSDIGLLYGTFRLLQELQRGARPAELRIASAPKLALRVLDHWDNLDGSVERGYAGKSLWKWDDLPGKLDPRYVDYARANASIGINGAVLNNVNARARSLTAPYIAKAAALADVFRPYGIRVYLSARFSAPIELGGLETADPLDPAVQAWWKAKADEIYRAIPDFGGFLVKANSEGQPGPQDYHRSHAEGANVLARALAPHGGVVMYRAFVYAHDRPEDRAKQAFSDFTPLDGKFDPNVIVQVKNGPIDFQPREPFHPLFGAMRRTPLMMEVQVTKEYLGFASHLVYLGPLFQEVLRRDTFAKGPGSTVARVLEGKVHPQRLTGMAGVANVGSDRDWCGSVFNQANWFVFGRLAWDPDASSSDIAREWLGLTFTPDRRFVRPALKMMMRSREAAVDYMTPMGLAHQMGTDHHYGPAPWVSDLPRPEWNPTYYARAGADGIGFDRTAGGSDAISQYVPELARRLADPRTASERELLWFHHLPWDWRMASGRTLWDELVGRYDHGVAEVSAMQRIWAGLSPYVDAERFDRTRRFLAVQHKEAKWWRDASIAWFQSRSGLPLPAGAPEPEHPLSYYQALKFTDLPGTPH